MIENFFLALENSGFLKRRSDSCTGADMEGEIVTEMLKNQNQSTGLQSRDRGGKEPLKPLFPKRNTTNRPTISLEDTTETAKAKRRTSKWSEYLTEEENEEAMAMATAVDNEAAAITHFQMVEEEIHPDFM